MLISILIPSYNAERWISQSIESALSQTWPKKEVIIVDDGSIDNSLQIAQKYQSKNVKVIYQKNSGAAAARNRAYKQAQGEYIQWLDADDLLGRDKVSRQLNTNTIDRDSRVLLSSGFGFFYHRVKNARFKPTSLWQDLTPVEWLLRKFNENIWMNPAVWLVSRKLTELAGPWDERLSLDDDGEYFARVVGASEEIKFVDEGKSYYRTGSAGSLSRVVSDNALKSLYLSLSLSIGYLRSLEDSERTRSACLRLLQTWILYFYPEQTEILKKVNDLAKDLGGELTPPDLRWKYYLIKKVLGWRRAKIAQRVIPLFKDLIRNKWDKILYNLSID